MRKGKRGKLDRPTLYLIPVISPSSLRGSSRKTFPIRLSLGKALSVLPGNGNDSGGAFTFRSGGKIAADRKTIFFRGK